MSDRPELFAEADPAFEESIRIDRELESPDPETRRERRYARYLDTYHLTEASVDFLEELFEHIHDPNSDPDERNHWLYGYYGSGKSHLLTTLDLLLDTQQLAATDRDLVWQRFDSQRGYDELAAAWTQLHDDVLIVPLPINLLRYQSVRDQSFSEIILQTIYQERGFAERLPVAFFEEEFQQEGGLFDTRSVWEQRESLLNDILREEGVPDPDYTWDDVRRYSILSDIVLERLTERATGMTANLADIQERNIGQQLAVNAIESYRQELQKEHDRPVKIVLLMDEVTLFIGDDSKRLAELNALAESVKDVGEGNILSVVTAQSMIEDVQPGLATKQIEFGVLKDRFPQQYALPSHHVGEIVQQRLLTKSEEGADWVREEAFTASVHPPSMLVYSRVGQNTEQPLDSISEKAFVEYYPLLPYQPALFLEILSNLRNELADATKSIFSGTARAILALVARLREDWARTDVDKPIISLVDFYDLVRFELEDIIPEKTDVIVAIEDDDETTAFDVSVAKAVLLLSYIPDMVPQTDTNIAVAVMDDLDGRPRSNISSKVRDSLEGNLEKYVRPDTSSDGAELRLTDREEQQLIADAHVLGADPDWGQVISALDEQLWDDITAELELPESHRYGDDEDAEAYPVGYTYKIDGQGLESGGREGTVFEADVAISGIHPDVDDGGSRPGYLNWRVETEGIEDLRSQLIEWWALDEATRSTNPPESLARDLDDAADRVVNKLVAALSDGSYQVEASEFDTFEAALTDHIDESYPKHFHPKLKQIDDSYLEELRRLNEGEENPDWARTIGVPPQSATGFATFSDLAFEVRRHVGTIVEESDGTLDIATILDRVIGADEILAEVDDGTSRPSAATLAVLWGLCRADVFRIMKTDGTPAPVDDVLSRSEHHSLQLQTGGTDSTLKDVFVDNGLIEPTATANTGYIVLDELLEDIETGAESLADDVDVQLETTFETEALSTLVGGLADAAREIASAAAARRADATTDEADELEPIVADTVAERDWLETAETRWEERLPFLLQLEGLLRLGAEDIDWLDADVETAIEDLSTELAALEETGWWTESGWKPFVRGLESRAKAIENLQAAWETQQETTGLTDIQGTLEEHPWLIPPLELPDHGVHEGFQAEYLDPLRGFRTNIDRIETVLEPLIGREPGIGDKERLNQSLGRLGDRMDWTAASEPIVAANRERLDTLERLVGDAGPHDLVGIGVLHTDAGVLEAQILGLDDDELDEPPEIDEVDGGVIVR